MNNPPPPPRHQRLSRLFRFISVRRRARASHMGIARQPRPSSPKQPSLSFAMLAQDDQGPSFDFCHEAPLGCLLISGHDTLDSFMEQRKDVDHRIAPHRTEPHRTAPQAVYRPTPGCIATDFRGCDGVGNLIFWPLQGSPSADASGFRVSL